MFESPRILVTNDYAVAKKFFNNSNKRLSQALLTQDEMDSLLVNPFNLSYDRENSYWIFESFEYSLGYGQGSNDNNFKITLKLNDIFSNLEQQFSTNLLSWDSLIRQANKIQIILDNLQQNQKESLGIKNILDQDLIFEETRESIVNKNTLLTAIANRTYYFILINEAGYYLDPIVSQFIGCTVEQSSKKIGKYNGIKQLKLQFLCAGHPNIISNLASLVDYSPERLEDNTAKSVKSTYYKITQDINLEEMLKNYDLIDEVVKNVISKLFKSITGKDIILVLPDFGKMFKSYNERITKDAQGKSLQSSVNRSGKLISYYLREAEYYNLKTFLNKLGFSCITPLNLKIFDEFRKISLEDKRLLDEFSRKIDEINNRITAAKTSNELLALLRELDVEATTSKSILGQPIPNINGAFKTVPANILGFDINAGTGGQYSKNYIFRPYINAIEPTPKNIQRNTFLITLGPNQSTQVPVDLNRLKEIIKDVFLNLLEAKIRIANKDYGALLDSSYVSNPTITADEVNDLIDNGTKRSVSGVLSFTIHSDQKNINPKPKNEINFYEFANNFSNNLQYLGDFPFSISFTEENNLSRLEILKKTVQSHLSKPNNRNYYVTNTTVPAIVIYESYMYDNYYLPFTGIPKKDNQINYPISDIDLENYDVNKNYHLMSLLEKIKQSNLFYRSIMLPFSVGSLTHTGNNIDLLVTPRDGNGNPVDFTYLQRQLALNIDYYFTKLTNWKDGSEQILTLLNQESTNVLPVFTYNPNDKIHTEVDNIIEYSLKADVANSTITYNSLVQKIHNQIFDDKLLSTRISGYSFLFKNSKVFVNFDQAKEKILEYLKQTDKSDLEKYKEDLITELGSITTLEDRLKLFIPDYDSKKPDTNKLTTEEKAQYTNSQQSTDFEYRKRIVNQLITDAQSSEVLKAVGAERAGMRTVNSYLGNDELNKTNLYNSTYNKIYNLEIETFPFFQINSIKQLNCPCLVLITNNYKPLQEAFNTYNLNQYMRDRLADILQDEGEGRNYSLISGMYSIISFSHTIEKLGGDSPEFKAKSRFTLRKNLVAGSSE